MRGIVQQVTQLLYNDLFEEINKKIQRIQLQKRVPEFTTAILIKLIQASFKTMSVQAQQWTQEGMVEEKQLEVARLQKDSLTPLFAQIKNQQLPEKIILNLQKSQLSKSATKSKASTTRQKVVKKLSISLPITKQTSINNENLLVKIKQQQLPSMQNNQNQEDPQIQLFRKQRMFYQSQPKVDYKKMEIQRQKSLHAKREKFKRQHQYKQFTFGFQGDPLNSTTYKNSINCCQMGVNLNSVETKLRSNVKFPPNRGETKQIRSPNLQNRKALDTSRQPIKFLNSHIPVFQETNKAETQKKEKEKSPKQFKTFKINEYKQLYGNKFTRKDHSLDNSLSYSQVVVSQKCDSNEVNEVNTRFSQPEYYQNMKKVANQGKEFLKNKMDKGNKKKIIFPKINGKHSAFDKFSFN